MFLLLESYAKGRPLPGPLPHSASPGGQAAAGFSTPARSSPAPATPLASTPPRSPALGAPPSPLPPDEEPTPSSVVEDLLRLVDAVAVAAAADPVAAGAMAEAGRVRLLLAVFRQGMADFRGGAYRVAAASAQVGAPIQLPSRSYPHHAYFLRSHVQRDGRVCLVPEL